MNFSLGVCETSRVFEKLPSTYVVEYPVQFVVQPVRKARKQASSSTEDHIAQ